MKKSYTKAYPRILDWYTDNDLVALIPEWWALESLMELQKNLVILPLVNRDYDKYFMEAGNVVNLNRTGDFTALRKQKGSKITVQSADASADTVELNQHYHVSYYLDDQDLRATMGDLRPKYIQKAAIAMAEALDMVITGEVYNFLDNAAGQAGAAVTDQYVRDLAEIFTRNNNTRAGRNCIVGPATENDLLGIDRFVEARMIGNGEAILNNMLGRMRGFDFYVASQIPEVAAGTTINTDNTVTANTPAGQTSIGVTEAGTDLVAGHWVLIAGDAQPHRIVSYTTAVGTGTMVLDTPLRNAVTAAAVISEYTSLALIAQAVAPAGYAAGYSGEIVVDTSAPEGTLKIGQGISFSTAASAAVQDPRYTITGLSHAGGFIVGITLNRPLDVALVDNGVVNPIPPANYNLAFMRDAMTFVNRPLQPADAGSGVNAAWNAYNGIAIRVTIGYDQDYMGQKVTLDTLCGVKTLDPDMGGILLS